MDVFCLEGGGFERLFRPAAYSLAEILVVSRAIAGRPMVPWFPLGR